MTKVNYQGTNDERAIGHMKKKIEDDPIMRSLFYDTPDQLEQWIDDNINDLASAKMALKYILNGFRYLIAHRNRD